MHPEDLRAIINAVQGSRSRWLNADEAADYLRCSVSRIRKLTMTGEIPHEKEGRRVLFDRDQLDEFIRSGGACTP